MFPPFLSKTNPTSTFSKLLCSSRSRQNGRKNLNVRFSCVNYSCFALCYSPHQSKWSSSRWDVKSSLLAFMFKVSCILYLWRLVTMIGKNWYKCWFLICPCCCRFLSVQYDPRRRVWHSIFLMLNNRYINEENFWMLIEKQWYYCPMSMSSSPLRFSWRAAESSNLLSHSLLKWHHVLVFNCLLSGDPFSVFTFYQSLRPSRVSI